MPDFQNPQQDPGMERRLLLVFVLTFIVILAFQPLLKKYLPQAPATKPPEQTQTASPIVSPASAASVEQPKVTVPTPGATKQASAESETVIENDLYRVTLTNRGGQVKSWILKKYDDDQGKPLEVVNTAAAQAYGYPLSLWTWDEAQRNKLNSVLYVVSNTGDGKTPGDITFEYADQDLTVRKTIHFDNSYVIHIEATVLDKGNQISAFPMWPAGLGDENSAAAYAASKIEYQGGSDVERVTYKKISSGNTVRGPFSWAAVSDQYFAAVFLPDDTRNAALVMLRNALDIPKDWRNPKESVKVDVLGTAVGNLKGPTAERLYVGPKILKIL